MNFIKVIVLAVFLFGCATPINNYARNISSECSKLHKKFDDFSSCFTAKIKPDQKIAMDDKYNESKSKLMIALAELKKEHKKRRITDTQAIEVFKGYVSRASIEEKKYIEEKSHNIAAGAIAAVAIGAVAATCISNDIDCFSSGGSSGSSYQEYSCDCPYDITSDGRRCGKMSAFIRNGGRSPQCDLSRIYASELIN